MDSNVPTHYIATLGGLLLGQGSFTTGQATPWLQVLSKTAQGLLITSHVGNRWTPLVEDFCKESAGPSLLPSDGGGVLLLSGCRSRDGTRTGGD